MMFTPRPTEMLPDIFFDGKRLEWVTDFKYLGVIIDGKLNFSLQAAEVYRKLSKMQGVFLFSFFIIAKTYSFDNLLFFCVLCSVSEYNHMGRCSCC